MDRNTEIWFMPDGSRIEIVKVDGDFSLKAMANEWGDGLVTVFNNSAQEISCASTWSRLDGRGECDWRNYCGPYPPEVFSLMALTGMLPLHERFKING